jgi:acetyltransferase-like isoleucine patch superfamily enzyme
MFIMELQRLDSDRQVVVAAGSVVRGKLESNTIYGGVPCRPIADGWYE